MTCIAVPAHSSAVFVIKIKLTKEINYYDKNRNQ